MVKNFKMIFSTAFDLCQKLTDRFQTFDRLALFKRLYLRHELVAAVDCIGLTVQRLRVRTWWSGAEDGNISMTKEIKKTTFAYLKFEYVEIEIDGFGSRHYLMTVDNLKTKQSNNRCH